MPCFRMPKELKALSISISTEDPYQEKPPGTNQARDRSDIVWHFLVQSKGFRPRSLPG